MALSNISVAVTEANVQVDITNTLVTVGQTVSNVIVGNATVVSNADVRTRINVQNVSGFGTLAYDNSTTSNGIIQYTGVSNSQIASSLSGGNGITVDSSGVIAIDRDTTSPYFNYASFSGGKLRINGVTTNSAYTLVARDADGDFAASNITLGNYIQPGAGLNVGNNVNLNALGDLSTTSGNIGISADENITIHIATDGVEANRNFVVKNNNGELITAFQPASSPSGKTVRIGNTAGDGLLQTGTATVYNTIYMGDAASGSYGANTFINRELIGSGGLQITPNTYSGDTGNVNLTPNRYVNILPGSGNVTLGVTGASDKIVLNGDVVANADLTAAHFYGDGSNITGISVNSDDITFTDTITLRTGETGNGNANIFVETGNGGGNGNTNPFIGWRDFGDGTGNWVANYKNATVISATEDKIVTIGASNTFLQAAIETSQGLPSYGGDIGHGPTYAGKQPAQIYTRGSVHTDTIRSFNDDGTLYIGAPGTNGNVRIIAPTLNGDGTDNTRAFELYGQQSVTDRGTGNLNSILLIDGMGNVTFDLDDAEKAVNSNNFFNIQKHGDNTPVSLFKVNHNGNVSLGGPLTSNSTITTTGNVTATGNVSGAYILGDGSLLTNLPGGGGGISNAQATAYIESNGLTMTAPISSSADISTTAFFEGDLNGAVTIDVYNNEASTLNKGEAVYLTGGNNGDNPWVAPADSDDATKMPAIGIVRENINAGAVGQVVTSGVMNNSSHGYTLGADLYIDSVAGGLTTTLPTGESKAIQKIGKVVSPNHIIVQGAFRSNQTPNLDNNRIFIGNAANRATTVGLDSLSTELYTSDTFGAKTLTQGQNGMFNSNTSGGDYLDMDLFTNPVFPNGTRIMLTGGVAGNPFTNGTITSDNVFYTQYADGGNYRLFTDSGLTSPTSSGQNDYTSADAPDVNYSALSVTPSGVTHTKDVVAADTVTIGESSKYDAVLTLHGEQSIYNANADQTALYIEANHASADASPKIMLRRNRSTGSNAGDKLGGIIFDGQSAASSVVYPLTGGALIAGSGNTGSFDEISYAGGGTDPNWSDSTAITGQNGTGDTTYFNGNTYYTKSIGGGGYQLYTNSALSTGSTSGLSGIYTGEGQGIEFASQGAPQRVTYANILTKVTSPTHSSEDGEIDFNVIKAGTETNILNVNSTGLKLDGNLQINADTDVSGLSGLTFDKSTNNLGLGTPTPKAALHIRGTSNESQMYMTEFNGGSGAGIDFRTFAAAGSESVPETKGNNKRIWERFHNAYDGTGSSGDGISTGFETAFAEQILTEASHSSQSVPVYYQLYNYRDGDTTQNPTPLLRARGNGEIEFGSPVGSAFTQNAVANTIIKPTGEITTTGNVTASYFKGDGSQLTGIGGGSTNSFGTLTVSGQTNIQASQANAQVDFVAGSGMTITTSGNTMTFASTAGASYGNAEVQNYLASGNNAGNIATKGNVIVAKHTGTVQSAIGSYFGSYNTGSNDQIVPSTDPQWTNSTLITFSGTTNGDLTFLNGNSYYTKSIGGGFYEFYTDSGLTTPVQSGLDGEAPTGLIASYPGEVESTLNVAGDVFTTGNLEVSSANVLTTITEYQGNNTTSNGDVIQIGADVGWYNGQYVTFQGATDSSLTFLNGNTYQVGTGGGSGTTWNLYTNYQNFTKLSTAIGTISNPSGPTLVDHRTPNDTSATIYGDLIVNANSVLKVNAIESFFPNQVINLTGLRVNDFKGNDPLNPPSYTNTQLATLQEPFPGGYIFVTGDRAVDGEGVPAYWSGTQWKYFSDNANVSYT